MQFYSILTYNHSNNSHPSVLYYSKLSAAERQEYLNKQTKRLLQLELGEWAFGEFCFLKNVGVMEERRESGSRERREEAGQGQAIEQPSVMISNLSNSY